MKKKTIAGLLILMLIMLCWIPFKQQQKIVVKAAYLLVFQQLSIPENWKNWQPDLHQIWKKNASSVNIKTDQNSFTILAPSIGIYVDHSQGFAFAVDENIGRKNSSYVCIPVPGGQNGVTIVNVIKRKNIFLLLYGLISKNTLEPDLIALKKYLETPAAFYGFDIRRTLVTDSNVVVIKKVVSAENKPNAIAAIRQELNDFVQKHQLKQVQPVIADIREAKNDSVRIMIGVPINRQTDSEGNVVFMHLPPHGRMLTGRFTGKYGNRKQLYDAMRTYLSDHNLASPEDPYEKYLDNKIPANDSSFVHLQVNFPIY